MFVYISLTNFPSRSLGYSAVHKMWNLSLFILASRLYVPRIWITCSELKKRKCNESLASQSKEMTSVDCIITLQGRTSAFIQIFCIKSLRHHRRHQATDRMPQIKPQIAFIFPVGHRAIFRFITVLGLKFRTVIGLHLVIGLRYTNSRMVNP